MSTAEGSDAQPEKAKDDIYTNAKGMRYLRIGGAGVRADACKPFKTTVKAFRTDPSGWHTVELTGFDEAFEVHVNWISEHGALNAGDEVEGVVNMHDGSFWLLRRVPKQVDEMELGL